MAEKNLMHTGQDYLPSDPEIMAQQRLCQELLYDFNQTRPSQSHKRQELLKKMFASLGDNVYIEPPLHANWAGHFCDIGHDVYINYNLTMVDDTRISIGEKTMIGPNVTLATAGHPLEAKRREQGYQCNKPITIGRNCWLGANVTILPGVTIGENTVIAANSLVTKNIPSNVLAMGSPATVIKTLEE